MAKTSKPKVSKPRTPKTKPGAPGAVGPGHNSDAGDDKPKLTPDEEQALFLNHRTAWSGLEAKRKVFKKFEDEVKAALKNDGFTIKMMKIADDLTTVKGEAKIEAEVEERLKVARWIGHPLGAQMDLFEQPDRTPSVDRAYEEGKRTSMENKRAKPSYAPETEQYRSFMAGYHDHQRELVGGMKAPEDVDQSTLANRD